MGISQLLPFLEKSTRHCNVLEFRGQTVAVDSYCWLHKGARSCALQLAKGENTDMYVTFCLKYIKMLLMNDIKPIMVFDGRRLPAKLQTEENRRELRKLTKKQGIELLRLGKVDEAYKFFKQCIDITPEMALALIKECRKINVDCIVSPYESDAQLAFFNINGIAECVITEDSDLLLFGCKKVLYKMDLNGNGQLVEADKIHLSMKMNADFYTFDKFRHMCILSGCDYLENLPGVGLKKALKFVTMTAQENPLVFLDKLPKYLNIKNLVVNDEYKEKFMIADATFKHQTVFNTLTKKLVPLNPIKTKPEYCKNAGDMFDEDEALQLALGNLNPLNMKRIDNWQPDSSILSNYSIWSNCFKRRTPKKEKVKIEETPKKRKISESLVEEAKLSDDQQINKEIEFYKKIPVEVESHNENSSVPPQLDPEISPVLGGGNPFIKQKKRISKFKITDPKDDKVIKSRFFASSNEEIEEKTDYIEEGESSPILVSNFNASVPENKESEDDNVEIQSSQSSEKENVAQYYLDDGSDDGVPYLPFVECECLIEEGDTVINTSPEHPTLSSLENIIEEPATKKIKLQSVSPAPKKIKKQLTIQDMFKRMSSN